MKKRILLALIVIFIVSLTTVFFDYVGTGGKAVTITIPVGSGAKEIAASLKTHKVISYPSLFLRYIKDDAIHLRAGVHTFSKSMGYQKALNELKRNVPMENEITVSIPEGYEVREIAQLLEEKGIVSKKDFTDAVKTAHTLFAFLPDDGNIEGYLFPATYAFSPNTGATDVVQAMLQAFSDKLYTKENLARAKELGMSFHEVLTLASVIEREAAKEEERPIISSVFHNRLKQGFRLESCATVQYILKERKEVLSVADTKLESPYNTYLHPGLPPAPIACPGEKSLHAALYPAETEYLFFVADGTGGHAFTKTYEEHLAAAEN